jgi:hypothetical protein
MDDIDKFVSTGKDITLCYLLEKIAATPDLPLAFS